MTRDRGGICAMVAACAAAALALVSAPVAGALPLPPYGNYAMNIEGRYDFHTWIWVLSPCANPGDCVSVTAIPQPIAKALHYRGEAPLADGRYTLYTGTQAPHKLRSELILRNSVARPDSDLPVFRARS